MVFYRLRLWSLGSFCSPPKEALFENIIFCRLCIVMDCHVLIMVIIFQQCSVSLSSTETAFYFLLWVAEWEI